MRAFLFLFFLAIQPLGMAQITGSVVSGDSKQPAVGARVTASDGLVTATDPDGKFKLNSKSFPVTLITKLSTFSSDTTVVNGPGEITIILKPIVQEIGDMVVTASRRQQDVEEVAVSMEIIKPSLIESKGFTNLEQTVNQSPGVFTMDGQASIRGGGGYSYGAGSRVLLVWNGTPMVAPDVGDVKWNAIPMENMSQIEVLKGASSVLYGSGALNGIVAITEREPGLKLEYSGKVQVGIYGNPRRESLKWWTKNPTFYQMDAYVGQMFKRVGYTFSMNGFTTEGYRKGAVEQRARVSGSLYFKSKIPNLKTGAFYSAQYQYTGGFILWESDSLAYIAQGGMDPKGPGSTVTYQNNLRLNVDPYIKYYDKKNNKHELRTRYYLVTTGDLSNIYASSKATMYYGDYSYQKNFNKHTTLFSGATATQNYILSPVFGNHQSLNLAGYSQLETKILGVDATFGVRVEYFKQDDNEADSKFMLGKRTLPVYPIFRTAFHKKVGQATHLRASFGQGVRFPSVAERYTATSTGGIIIFPNPSLRPEKGWAGEIGVKQVFMIDKWKGIIDVAGFINQYTNMIEYTFGIYNPDSVILTPDNITSWVGFKAKNAERARITGIEFSFNSEGKIGPFEISTLMGYTYMNPITLNNDPLYLASFSDTNTKMLKYRFKHLAKADVEIRYKRISAGASCRYNSFMSNIDRVFEEPIVGTYVLPGLKEYRQIYNQGSLVFDVRFGVNFTEHMRMMFIINNVFNAEYSSRPADIQPPRNFMIQLKYAVQ